MLVNESMTNGKITFVKNEKKNSNDNEISEVLNNFFSRVSTWLGIPHSFYLSQ